MATETMAIIEAGGYRSPGGRDVRIAPGIKAAVAGTRLHLPGEKVPAPRPARDGALITEVTNETSLSAARRLGANVACLVFASAKNPGGGFLTGAQAQEESIARSSALHPCQNAAREFYDFHRRQRDLRYSDRIIYSPGVLGARAERILTVAASHGHRKLVLGAAAPGKKRYETRDGLIRAAQGHSVAVDLGLEARQPPPVLYHGTVARFIDSIAADGLRPGSRTHVHLSADQETATAVGARRGRPVVLVVDSAAMSAGGHEFFQASNGVWLTLHVPPAVIGFPDGSPAPELAP